MGNSKPPKSLRKYCFKPGQSGNPEGGRKHNPELRAIKRLTSIQIAEIGSLVLSNNVQELREIALDAKENPYSEHSSMKAIMASAMVKSFAKGDMRTLNELVDRIVGKVKEKIELTGEHGGPIRKMVGEMSPEEQVAELKRLRKLRKEAGED